MPASNPVRSGSIRILVVEDEAPMRRAISSALNAMSFVVDTAAELPAAQALLEEHTYDLALVDLSLRQGQGGFVLIRRIRAANLPTPIVVVSSTRDHEDILAAFRLGAVDFVSKPVRVTELACVVRRILKRSAVAANATDPSRPGDAPSTPRADEGAA